MKKKIIIIIITIFILTIIGILIKNNNKYNSDIIKYKGNTYVLLEYNMDIFTYNFINKNNIYYEEDKIHKLPHNKYNLIYFNGDIFVLDKQVKEATEYYTNDKNYDWFIVVEEDDITYSMPINLNKEEITYLYNMESINKDLSIKFEEIEMFVDIMKISKDGFIGALINLIHYDDSLFWKTEIMNDYDEEYIIELKDSINNKIFTILNNKE